MHTKKTNNTNKLMQISYYSALTKIQKLQNYKKKKKKKLFSVPAGITRNWPVWLVHGWYGRYLNQYETLMFRYRCTYRYCTTDTNTVFTTLVHISFGIHLTKTKTLEIYAYYYDLNIFFLTLLVKHCAIEVHAYTI